MASVKKFFQIILVGFRWIFGILFLLLSLLTLRNIAEYYTITPIFLTLGCALIPPINNFVKHKLNINLHTYFVSIYAFSDTLIRFINNSYYQSFSSFIIGVFFMPQIFSKFISLLKVKNKMAIFFIGLVSYLAFSLVFSSVGIAFNLTPSVEVQQIKSLIDQNRTSEALKVYKIASPPTDDWIIQNNAKLDPPFLYILADRIFDKNKQDAIFWFSLGKYRSYYDGFRCKDSTSRSGLSLLGNFAPKTAEYINSHTQELMDITPKVIEYDKQHPSTNSPRWICAHGINNFIDGAETGIVDKAEWSTIKANIANALTQSVEMYKKRIEKEQKLKKSGLIIKKGNLQNSSGDAFKISDNEILFIPKDLGSDKSIEIFDVNSGNTEIFNSNFQKRYNSELTLLNNQTILQTGGAKGASKNGEELEVQKIDIIAKSVSVNGNIKHKREKHTATFLNDGNILIVGGGAGEFKWENNKRTNLIEPTGKAEIYNPKTGTSEYVGEMNHPRWNHSALLLPDGKVLIAGGSKYFVDDKDLNLIDEKFIEIYNPSTKIFEIAGKLNNDMEKPTLILLPDNKVLILGNKNNGSEANPEIFDLKTGKTEELILKGFKVGSHDALLLNDGNVFIFGPNEYRSGTSYCEILNPNTKTFKIIDNIQDQRINPNLTLLPDGRVVVMGGREKSVLLINPAAW